uniref:MRN complex-interacting protein N-terminal domain-containing protein n=1 Tax=Spongospora subterranea TaxID=70186 RepID=A0A0H5RAY9_9EUKA|eukprot:CRZ11213.1 hypothetical protein [Spongospora subterranea]
MPEFIIVRCSECSSFQIRQQRKDAKFTCVLCCTGQSVRKIYSRSESAGALRPVVQNLNMDAGTMIENRQRQRNEPQMDCLPDAVDPCSDDPWSKMCHEIAGNADKPSKWDGFLGKTETVSDDGEYVRSLGPVPILKVDDTQITRDSTTRKRCRKQVREKVRTNVSGNDEQNLGGETRKRSSSPADEHRHEKHGSSSKFSSNAVQRSKWGKFITSDVINKSGQSD